jgi:hypothetical protein
MLTFNAIANAPTTTTATAKQITLISNTNGASLYTVPVGRKFSGQAWGGGTTEGAVQINSTAVYFAGSNYNITPLVLAAEAVVTKFGSGWVYIVGVEEAA